MDMAKQGVSDPFSTLPLHTQSTLSLKAHIYVCGPDIAPLIEYLLYCIQISQDITYLISYYTQFGPRSGQLLTLLPSQISQHN